MISLRKSVGCGPVSLFIYTSTLFITVPYPVGQPNWDIHFFEKMRSGNIWIVDGDHEEAVERYQQDDMARWLPDAGQLLLPQVSLSSHSRPLSFAYASCRFRILHLSKTLRPLPHWYKGSWNCLWCPKADQTRARTSMYF